jgi:hypothetical protein
MFICHPLHRSDGSRLPERKSRFLARARQGLPSSKHSLLEAFVHFCCSPPIGLVTLDPFEVGDDDTADIGEDIRDHQNTEVVNYLVGYRCGGAAS